MNAAPPAPHTCTSFECDGRYDPDCEACEAALEEAHAYWLRQWNGVPLQERDPKRYAQQMIDAGRAALLSDDERALVR